MKYEIDQELMHRLYNVLSYYANETSYEAPRIGGVVAGCPRGKKPQPDELVWSARWMLRDLERQVLKRDAWDWIGKYEPIGPHCPSCRCTTPSLSVGGSANTDPVGGRAKGEPPLLGAREKCERGGYAHPDRLAVSNNGRNAVDEPREGTLIENDPIPFGDGEPHFERLSPGRPGQPLFKRIRQADVRAATEVPPAPSAACSSCGHSYEQHTKGPVQADYCRHCPCPAWAPPVTSNEVMPSRRDWVIVASITVACALIVIGRVCS